MVMYSVNVLIVTYFQNAIWDYVTDNRKLLKPTVTATVLREYRIGSNLAMGNALFAIGITFISPLFAFITLFLRTFMFRRSAQQYIYHLTQRNANKKKKEQG